MSERVPRRLQRFYREKNSKQGADERGDEFSDYQNNKKFEENNLPEEEITHIPSMNYEDVDEKNLNEIKKVEQQNLAQKLATLEVKKFKEKNNRLPNKRESEQLASSLLKQLDENSLDGDGEFSFHGSDGRDINQQITGRQRRHGRHRETQVEEKETRRRGRDKQNKRGTEKEAFVQEDAPTAKRNIKDLFGEDDETDSSEEKDTFDLDDNLDEEDDSSPSEFDDDNDSDLDELEELAGIDKKKKKKK